MRLSPASAFRPQNRRIHGGAGSFAGQAGLTLGEMLVVLAVFLVLSAIFIFSSQTAMVKTRLSRVMQEQRLLSRALDAYEADAARVPPDAKSLSALPTAILPQVPEDPFNRQAGRYDYYSRLSERCKWVVISVGPDGVSNLAPLLSQLRLKRSSKDSQDDLPPLMTNIEADRLIRENMYDPTNGSVSAGDVITPGIW